MIWRRITELFLMVLSIILLVFVLVRAEKSNTVEFGNEKSIRVVFPFVDGEKYVLNDVSTRWKFETVCLGSDSERNEIILKRAKSLLNRLKDSKDTLHGICIEFPDEILFQDYFHAIEICNEKEPRVFISGSNYIYAIANFRSSFNKTSDPNELLGFE